MSCILVYNQDLREDMVKTFPEAHVSAYELQLTLHMNIYTSICILLQ